MGPMLVVDTWKDIPAQPDCPVYHRTELALLRKVTKRAAQGTYVAKQVFPGAVVIGAEQWKPARKRKTGGWQTGGLV